MPAGDGLIADYEAVRRETRGLSATTVRLYGYLNRAAPTNQQRVNAYGVDVEGPRVLARALIAGTMFGENDVRTAASVCIIPQFLAQAIFGDIDVIGRTIQIADTPFTVIAPAALLQQKCYRAGSLLHMRCYRRRPLPPCHLHNSGGGVAWASGADRLFSD